MKVSEKSRPIPLAGAQAGDLPPGGRRRPPSPFAGRDGAPAVRRQVPREHTRWDPKDGELCLARTKPEETLVEVRTSSDVQIDCQSWV